MQQDGFGPRRLYQLASRTGRPFQEVVQNFAMERFLYRLGSSPHGEKFILKGALMLAVWGGSSARPTRDIDLLALEPLDNAEVLSVFRALCDESVEEDGLVFDRSTVACAPIRAASEGLGHQVTFLGMLGSMRVAMQADIGFGDIVHPGPILAEYPVLLDLEGPRIHGYTRETVIAEKLEAMVRLGIYNSRMKDFHDIVFLSSRFGFDGQSLSEAIQKTFANRRTRVPGEFRDFLGRFAGDPQKLIQWEAFARRLPAEVSTGTLGEVCRTVSAFAGAPLAALGRHAGFQGRWNAGGPWVA